MSATTLTTATNIAAAAPSSTLHHPPPRHHASFSAPGRTAASSGPSSSLPTAVVALAEPAQHTLASTAPAMMPSASQQSQPSSQQSFSMSQQSQPGLAASAYRAFNDGTGPQLTNSAQVIYSVCFTSPVFFFFFPLRTSLAPSRSLPFYQVPVQTRFPESEALTKRIDREC